ncbi:DNA-directed RNA polymerase I(A) and III(C) family protein [Salix suchowensis]|nr:DNA-directed RNA polymerase I(A) and III(C) family protein [Salix suchowensis]
MEHGSVRDPSSATFCFVDEDHTLANSVRFALNQDPRVSFCGYSIPHPSDAKVNIRVQTTGVEDACQNLMVMCQHVRSTLDKAVDDYRRNPTDMDTK